MPQGEIQCINLSFKQLFSVNLLSSIRCVVVLKTPASVGRLGLMSDNISGTFVILPLDRVLLYTKSSRVQFAWPGQRRAHRILTSLIKSGTS